MYDVLANSVIVLYWLIYSVAQWHKQKCYASFRLLDSYR